MALEYHTGFDFLPTGSPDLTQLGWTEGSGTIVSSPVRTGARAFTTSSTGYIGMPGLSQALTRVLGVGYYVAGPGSQRVFMAIGEGGSLAATAAVHMGLSLDATGHLEARRGGQLGGAAAPGTLVATSTNTLSQTTWYFIELVLTVDNTVGRCEVYVNGSKTGWIDFTGDTQNTANAYSTTIGIGGGLSGASAYLDDVYTLTGTGAAPTTRLGDCKSVVKLAGTDAALGAGTYADSTPSTGTDRGAMVDEAQPDDDTTYTSLTAALQKDSYKMVALGQTGTILGATVRARLKKADAGDGSAQIGLRSGSTDDLSVDVFPSDTSYLWFSRPYTVNPASALPWTVGALDLAQILVKRTL